MEERHGLILKTSVVGIISNVLLAAFKALIGFFASSIAITLDAVNNLTDAISSIITIVGVYVSGKNPDKKHPFGYGRVEYLSTLAIGIIILYAGVSALIESVKNIITPKQPEYNSTMLYIIVVAVFVKIALGLFYNAMGKKAKSDSLLASGKDALFDAMISAATIIAALIYLFFSLSIEAYIGIIISIIIIKSGIEILKETISKLLGEGASVELVKAVKKTIAGHDGVRGAYDLVLNNYGQDIYTASVHIEIFDRMSANEIDKLCRHITKDIYDEFGILLTAIGIYSYSTVEESVRARTKFEEIAKSHEYVNQVHGFYMDKEDKEIRFDMVISFDAPDRAKLYEHVIADLEKEFPDYEISGGMDVDFNEI